jgi:hypothetical protein
MTLWCIINTCRERSETSLGDGSQTRLYRMGVADPSLQDGTSQTRLYGANN